MYALVESQHGWGARSPVVIAQGWRLSPLIKKLEAWFDALPEGMSSHLDIGIKGLLSQPYGWAEVEFIKGAYMRCEIVKIGQDTLWDKPTRWALQFNGNWKDFL